MEPQLQGDIYYIRFSFQRQQRRLSLRTPNKKLAQRICDQVEGGLDRGVFDSLDDGSEGRAIFETMVSRPGLKAEEAADSLRSKSTKKNLAEAIDEYLKNCETEHSPRNYKNELRVFTGFKQEVQAPFVHGVAPEMIEKWRNERVVDVDKSTVNRELKMLKRFFRQCVEKDYIRKSPAENLKTYREAEKVIRHLSDDEVKKLLDAAPTDLKQIITFLLLTGLRYGELCYLTWNDIDFRHKQVIVQPKEGWTPKNLKKRVIPMQPIAEQILKDLNKRRNESEFLFPEENGKPSDNGIRNRIGRIFDKAKVQGSVKSLRSTFASNLVMGGYPIYTVSKLLGHHDTKITERHYAHLATDYLQNVMTTYAPKWASLSAGKVKELAEV